MKRVAPFRPLVMLLSLAASLAPAVADPQRDCGASLARFEAAPTTNGVTPPVEGGTEIVLAGLAFPDGGPTAPAEALASLAGQEPRVLPVAPADRYGRIRALVFDAGGRLVQAEMIRAGLAVVRPEDLDDACATALLAVETEAQSAGRGFWRGERTITEATDEASLSARSGLYALVQGRVVSVGYGSRMVFIDFGRNFRKDFTVLVPESLQSRLLEAGIPMDSLEGRTVRVRGVIEESGGPAIRLAHPLALELVDGTE